MFKGTLFKGSVPLGGSVHINLLSRKKYTYLATASEEERTRVNDKLTYTIEELKWDILILRWCGSLRVVMI